MTQSSLCEIVTQLQAIGIGMTEAKVFVAVNGNSMKEISVLSKTPHNCSNKLFFLMRKGLVKIEKIKKSRAIYSHTEEGKKAMKTLTDAGM